MELHAALRARHSTRAFSSRPVEDALLRAISASGFGLG